MKIKDTNGQEIEVFTPQEVEEKTKVVAEAAAKKAIDEYKVANPDKSPEVNKLQADLTDAQRKLQDALDAGGEDTPQIKRLRQERDDANRKLGDSVQALEKKLDDFKALGVTSQKEQLLVKLVGTDVELKKKVEFEFDNYRANDVTPQAIQERMEKAFQLATGNKPSPSAFDGLNSGSRGSGYEPSAPTKITENQKAIGSVLGISDADREKYGKKK